jgi:hypothetical protein
MAYHPGCGDESGGAAASSRLSFKNTDNSEFVK